MLAASSFFREMGALGGLIMAQAEIHLSMLQALAGYVSPILFRMRGLWYTNVPVEQLGVSDVLSLHFFSS